MTNNTPKKYRFIKFVAWEVSVFIAGPTGVYVGGKLLGTGNYDRSNLHNYQQVFITSTGCALIAFFWVLFVINENQGTTKSTDMNSNKQKLDDSDQQKQVHQVCDKFEMSKVFDWKNVRDIYVTSVKVRPNRGRLQIWLLMLSNFVLFLSDGKVLQIVFPFAEKVYNWDAKHFSDIRSLSSIIQIVTMTLIPPFLSTYLKLNESNLGIIGVTSMCLSNIAIGTVIAPLGLYLMYGLGSVAGMAYITVRALVSKIVCESESGKIFALQGALEQIFPTVQALVFSWLFAFTVDWYPSLSFQVCAALNFVQLFIFIWLDLTHNKNSEKIIE